MKQVSYNDLIENKKLATRIGNRVHSQRSAYHKSGPVTVLVVKPAVQAVVGIQAPAAEALF